MIITKPAAIVTGPEGCGQVTARIDLQVLTFVIEGDG